MGKKPKVFLGTLEIGGSIAIYAREFKKLGYPVHTAVMFKNWAFPLENYDSICLDEVRHNFQYSLREDTLTTKFKMFSKIGLFGLREFIKNIGKNNWFIFIYGSNFLPFHYSVPFLNFIDYAILKKFGNNIISIFVGCDIRYKPTFSEYARKYQIADQCYWCSKDRMTKCDPRRVKRVIRGAEKYSDLILTVPDISFALTRPYYYFWIPLEINSYNFHIPRNKIPHIIHAPSERVFKGTDKIITALNQLEEDGFKFKKVFLEKCSNETVKKELSAGDILIDQVNSNSTGKLSVEGMACGCAVLCGLHEIQGLPEDCPAISTGRDQVYRNLKHLLENRQKIYAAAIQGRKYVEKYHDSSKVVKQIIHWIEDRPEDELIFPKH